MADLIDAALFAGDDTALAVGVFLGLAFALFAALMWLRLWRWFFSLLGLRA